MYTTTATAAATHNVYKKMNVKMKSLLRCETFNKAREEFILRDGTFSPPHPHSNAVAVGIMLCCSGGEISAHKNTINYVASE